VSFLTGSFSSQRFAAPARTFGEEDVAALAALSVHHTRTSDADGVGAGWCGGLHEADGELTCEKNLRGEFLHWSFRVSKVAYPAARLKALYHDILKGMMDASTLEHPTAKMRQTAREEAQGQIEEEGNDGRYVKHTVIPVVWDGKTGQVWYGATSHSNVGLFADLFTTTFGVEVQDVTAGTFAGRDDFDPAFCEEVPAWIPDAESDDWLGNEFGLWVLWRADAGEGLNWLPVKRLTLACPYGMHGSDTFTHEFPVQLPEVRRALEEGKLPRDLGLCRTDGDDPSSLTLQPERWAVSGVRLPEEEELPDGRQRDVARLEQCRALFAGLDELVREFVEVRAGDGWGEVAGRITAWTGRAVPAGV
jgi:hypothetical protein